MKNAFARSKQEPSSSVLATVSEDRVLSRGEFAEVLTTIDSGLRALPATAQVAKQQGEYLRNLLAGNKAALAAGEPLPEAAEPFRYRHKGSLAYVGSDRAVMDVPTLGPLTGMGIGAAPL